METAFRFPLAEWSSPAWDHRHYISKNLEASRYSEGVSDLDLTAMFRALGDPTRRAIFEFLCTRCCPVAVEEDGAVHPVQGVTVGEVCCHVTGEEKFSSTISFHLKELRLAGLIRAEKQGKFMVCSARAEAIDALTEYLHSLPRPGQTDCLPNVC